MKQVDSLVVGLGAMGSATLYHLARMGQHAVGIEQFRTGHELGSSHGHSRAFRVFYRDPLYTELAAAALPLWQDLQAAATEPLLSLCGFLAFARTGNPLFERNLAAIRHSQADFELLTSRDITARFPALEISDSHTACFTPQAGFLDASRCVTAHLAGATGLGATVHQQVCVERIETIGARTIVHTTAGDFRTRRLILTAGPWAADLLSPLQLPLTVTRQQKFYFQPTCPAALRPDVLPVYADYDTRFYGFPMHGPGLKVADDTRGRQTHPDRVDRTTERAAEVPLSNWLKNLMPQHEFQFLEASTCLYTGTPDLDFLIGPHPNHPGILAGAGFSGHGFKFSTLIGLILAQLAVEGSTPYPIERFALDRFSPNPQ